jgi:hypothetical protein
MTPAERAAWFNTSQGVPMLAFELMGVFDDVIQERETEQTEAWDAENLDIAKEMMTNEGA